MKIINSEDCLAIKYPELTKEWHPTKNGTLTPFDITYGCNKKVWWECFKGHEWEATPNSRIGGGTGCPHCKKSFGEILINLFLDKMNYQYVSQKTFDDCYYKKVLQFDFCVYINSQILLIEYQGNQHYKPVSGFGGIPGFILGQYRDKLKKEYCKNKNIPLLIIPYWKNKNIENLLQEFLILN